MLKEIRPAIVFVVALTVITGLLYPFAMTGDRRGRFPLPGAGEPDRTGRQGGRIGADRAGLHQRRIFPRPSVRHGCARPERFHQDRSGPLQRGEFRRLESWPDQQGADRTGARRRREAQAGESLGSGSDRSGDDDSGSGLDPDISPAAALFQVPRVAKARNMPEDRVRQLVDEHVEGRTLGFLGEPRINVLALNLALDRAAAR